MIVIAIVAVPRLCFNVISSYVSVNPNNTREIYRIIYSLNISSLYIVRFSNGLMDIIYNRLDKESMQLTIIYVTGYCYPKMHNIVKINLRTTKKKL